MAPGHTVSSKVRLLPVVDVAGSERLLQTVLESLLWSPSLTMASGKFAEHDDFWEAMVFHNGHFEHDGNVENTSRRRVFSTFLKCSQTTGVFHHCVIHGLGFFICFKI